MKFHLELDPEESKGLLELYKRSLDLTEERRKENAAIAKEVGEKVLAILPLFLASRLGPNPTTTQAIKAIRAKIEGLDPEKMEAFTKSLKDLFGEEGSQEVLMAMTMLFSEL